MQTVLHTADSRGQANHGWLQSRHTFSFADYYDSNRMHVGVLRVLNDDQVAGGQGFGAHPHRDMEIVSIPLEGALAHRDSMGNGSVIRQGDVQVMSAGTGVVHSEMNASADQTVKFLQIWVLTRRNGVEPRYQQIHVADAANPSGFQQILSPNADDAGVWIHQDAWFSLAKWQAGTRQSYSVQRAGNGVYAFVIKGSATVGGIALNERDGLGLWDTDSVVVEATSDTEVLLMDVPMDVAAATQP